MKCENFVAVLIKVITKNGKIYEKDNNITFFIINLISKTLRMDMKDDMKKQIIDFHIHYILLLRFNVPYVKSLRYRFHLLLQKRKDLKEIYLNKISNNYPLLYLLTPYVEDNEKSKLISVYQSEILGSKKEIIKSDLLYFTPLFMKLSNTELSEILIPAFIKAMKRNAILLVSPILHFTSNCNLDLTPFYLDLFLPLLNEFITSSEAPKNNIILEYTKILLSKSIKPDLYKDIINYISKLISSKQSDSNKRLLYISFFIVLLECVTDSIKEQYRELASKILFESIKKETNDSVLKLTHYLIGKWISSSCTIYSDFVKYATPLIKSNSSKSLLPLISLSPLYELSDVLSKDLEAIFKKGIESPASHIYLGWLTIPHLKNNDFIWDIINDKNSYLYHDRLYQYTKNNEECIEYEYIWMTICNIIDMIGKENYTKLNLNNCNEIPHPLFTVLAKLSVYLFYLDTFIYTNSFICL